MLPEKNAYNTAIPGLSELKKIAPEEITEILEKYLEGYEKSFGRSQQIKYFRAFEKGLLSNLDRKSIEPISLSFLGESEVRGMQQFFTRSKGWDEALGEEYKKQLGEKITSAKGFLSVDESDFVKKGKESVGVGRQYCGRTGKTDNSQAGVFLSYASEKGIGIVDSSLYIPKEWFTEEYADKRLECQMPESMKFKTKNKMAKEMMSEVIKSELFEVECIGCDASFGSDHTFLDSLPSSMYYFASVRENENIYRTMPQVTIPERVPGKKTQFKHPRSLEQPVHIKTIIDDESIPWVKRTIAEGAKGPVIAEVKCLRCVSCRKENRLYVPKSEVWVYIRKHEDGKIKYFICNMPQGTDMKELDRLATMRWSIEQCFQECKSCLGMAHYETRSYPAWHRHMQMVMIAQLFITILREFLKKIYTFNDANGSIHHCFSDTHSHKIRSSNDDYSLSLTS